MNHYILYNERFSEPIIQTQVLALLIDYNHAYPNCPFGLIAFQNPFEYLRDWARRKELVQAAVRDNLNIRVFPFALPMRGWMAGAVGVLLHRLLFRLTSSLLPSGTVVCRGYMCSLLCTQVSSRRRLTVIADPRSLFVRENIGNRWQKGDARHQLWLALERAMVKGAKRLIVVNRAMADYYLNGVGASPESISTIPIYSRSSTKRQAVPPNDRTKLIYVGSLSHSKWNDIEAYRKFFTSLRPFHERIELVVIVKHGGPMIDQLRTELLGSGLKASLLVSLRPQEVQAQMSQAHIGLVISDAWEDSSARTGVKTVEYLANGLVIWTTKHFSDVARMLRDADVGHVFESSAPGPHELMQALDDYSTRRETLETNIRQLYETEYSPRSILARVHQVVSGGSSANALATNT